MSFATDGSMLSNPTLGLNKNQNTNYGLFSQPPTSNIGAGLSIGSAPQTQSVSNPLQGGGQPSNINVPATPAPTGAPMPAGWQNFGIGMDLPNMLQTGMFPKLGTPQPTTAIKKTTSVDANGNPTSTEYHAPTPPPSYDVKNGFLTDYRKSAGDKAVQPGDPMGASAPVSQTPPGINANNGTSFPQNLSNIQSTGEYTPQEKQSYQGLSGQSNTPSQAYTDAQNKYQTAVKNLQDLKTNLAKYDQGIEAQGIPMAGIIGQEANLSRSSAAQLDAAQQAVTEAEQGMSYANTQQGLQVQAGTAAGGLAQTQAQRNLGAQENVAGLTQPQPYGITSTPYQPGTNTFGKLAGTANSDAGGLQGIGNIQGQIGVGQNVAQLNSYLGGANVVGNNLNDLITQNKINPVGLTYANGALQFGARAMSNPAYQKFVGQINDFVVSLAPILGVGGSATDMKTQMSSQIVNALQSGSTIKDVVSYFLNQAQQKIQGLSAGGGAPVGSAPAGAGTPQGSGTVSAGGYTFIKNADGTYSAQ